MQKFLEKHRLPNSYYDTATIHFEPLVHQLIAQCAPKNQTVYIALNGCQGSGKTTLADYLVMRLKQQGLLACAVSIDDFYLTYQARQLLGESVHPLLATRGVPGTHDVSLAIQSLQHLSTQKTVALPHFDKAIDDRADVKQWQVFRAPLDIVILEGWCVNIPPQKEIALLSPINPLERNEDSKGIWRAYVNQQLQSHYGQLWAMFDYRVMLKAPDFDCVYHWRLEQEEKLRHSCAGKTAEQKVMNGAQIKRFISHYERLTRHAIEILPTQSDWVFELDNQRNIIASQFH